ncbi:MAG: hypothetical protein EZS28_053417, partial [Streblomastix strix]
MSNTIRALTQQLMQISSAQHFIQRPPKEWLKNKLAE